MVEYRYMKKTLIRFLLTITVLAVLAGCSTPLARKQTMTALVMISQAGMSAYVSVALPNCKGDALCEDKINQRYAVYTNAVNAAWTAAITFDQYGTNEPVLLRLMSALTAAGNDVTRAILEAQRK